MKTPHYFVAAILFVFTTLLLNACSGTSNSSDSSARWRTAELIEKETGNAVEPQIAIDDRGNAITVWEQQGSPYNIWANRYTTGSGWDNTAAENIQKVTTEDSYSTQIAIDADGNAMAVWVQKNQDNNLNDEIWANHYTANTDSWGTAERIDNANDDAEHPQIAIDANGNAVAVWSQSDDIWANHTTGSGWDNTAAERIDVDGPAVAEADNHPQIAMNAGGKAVAVWSQVTQIGQLIYARHYTTGIGWEIAHKILGSSSGDKQNPQIAIDADGNAMAVWDQNDDIRSNRYYPVSGWEGEDLVESQSESCSNPQVAMDADGNSVVVWQQGDGSTDQIWANRHTPGGPNLTDWDNEERIDNANDDAEHPQIAIDANGNAVAVWSQSDDIWANRYTARTGNWGTAETIVEDNSSEEASEPQIAMNANGNAVVVWYQGNGEPRDIWSNRFE